MVDRLHLIAEVYSRPALWNLQRNECQSREYIPDLWKEVATSMGPNVTVDECKRKWKNLRDAYRAEIKRIEMRIEKDILNGTYDPKNYYGSKWVYFEHMDFIKAVKRSRRSNLNDDMQGSSSDNNDDDNYDLELFSDFYNIENIKVEPDTNAIAEIPSAVEESPNDDDSHRSKELPSKGMGKEQTRFIKNSLPKTAAITVNVSAQASAKIQQSTRDKPVHPCCKCSKRSCEQIFFLENLEEEEQKLMKSTRLDIARSNNIAHVGDSDYNFLVSFLPQLKKMNELQNLQFRAKMTDCVFTIMSQSMNNNATIGS